MIRLATLQDLPILEEIYDIARAYMRAHGNMTQWADGHPNKNDLTVDIENQRLYVVEENGEIEGSFVFYIGIDPTYVYIADGQWLNDKRYGVLHKVASRQRIRGVAKAMIAYGKEHINNLRMDTHADNIPMQHFLEKNGFQHVGTIFLANGDPRLAYHYIDQKEGEKNGI